MTTVSHFSAFRGFCLGEALEKLKSEILSSKFGRTGGMQAPARPRPGVGPASAGPRWGAGKTAEFAKNAVIYMVLGPKFERTFAPPVMTKSLECQK